MTDAARLRMAEPTQTCLLCNRVVTVVPSGRGFPPDVAARKLAKICAAAGHVSRPQYRAGLVVGVRPPEEP